MGSNSGIGRVMGLSLVIFGIKYILPLMVVSAEVHQNEMPSMEWQHATATWYGEWNGFGSDGGACAYGDIVKMNMIKPKSVAVSDVLFLKGKGCGTCYELKCLISEHCLSTPITVIVTDECPQGGVCYGDRHHFDCGGTAFQQMARPGKAKKLAERGVIPIKYRRTECEYPGKNIAFRIMDGSNPYWMSIVVEFENGDGDIGSMHVKEKGSDQWLKMTQVWGASYCFTGRVLKAPLSLKVTTRLTNSTLIASQAIPSGWAPGNTFYAKAVNFHG